MELDWYSKKQFSSCSARRVAALANFMGHVGARLLLVKPFSYRLSNSVSSRTLLAASKKRNDAHDDLLDFQPQCLSLGRLFSHLDMKLRRKHYHVSCFACVLHI